MLGLASARRHDEGENWRGLGEDDSGPFVSVAGARLALSPSPAPTMSSPTDYARAWLPKTPSRLVPILIGAGLFTWVLLSLAGPPGPPPPPPGYGRPWRDHRDPRLGFDPPIPTRLRPYPPPRPDAPTSIWSTRADKVREAFLHAYAGYKRYAPDHDELLPLTNKGVNKCVSEL